MKLFSSNFSLQTLSYFIVNTAEHPQSMQARKEFKINGFLESYSESIFMTVFRKHFFSPSINPSKQSKTKQKI